MRATECLRREPKSGWTKEVEKKRPNSRKKNSRTEEIICLCPFGRKPVMSGAEETMRSTIQREDISKSYPSMKKNYSKTLKKKVMRRRRLIGL